MKYQHVFLVLVSALGLLACSSQSTQKPKLSEVFNTDIKSSGLKQFTYTVVDLSSNRASVAAHRQKELDRGTKSLDQTRKKRNLKTVQDRKRKEIVPLLEAKIVETGFCQGGYRMTNSYFRQNRSEIKGECNDTATKQDRIKFQSTASRRYDTSSNSDSSSDTNTNTGTEPGTINSDNMILNLP